MDFAIKSLLPMSGSGTSSTNVVDQDPTKMVEEFARMLVAQISNQDPEKPMDPSEIVSQNAQMTSSLATVRLANQMAHYSQVAAVLNATGKVAEYIDPTTQTSKAGRITGADFNTTPPSLLIDGKQIPMDAILRLDGAETASGTSTGQSQANQIALLGKTVEYFDPHSETTLTGRVDDVDMLAPERYLTINGASVPMENIIRVIN